MFDFPNSPTVGQTTPGPGGVLYQWDGVKWVLSGSGAAVTGVSSFNSRQGAVVLNSPDVTTALGYTPLSPATGNANYVQKVGDTMTGDLYTTAVHGVWYVDPTYTGQMSGSNPVMFVDSNDYMVYDRTTNSFDFRVAGTNSMVMASNNWWTGLAGFGIGWSGTQWASVNFNANDNSYLQYDQSGKTYYFNISGTNYLYLSNTWLAFPVLSNAGFTWNNTQYMMYQQDSGDYYAYDRTNNNHIMSINSSWIFQCSTSNFYYFPGGTTAMNVGLNDTYFYSGGNEQLHIGSGFVYFTGDGNFFLGKISGAPYLRLNSSNQIYVDAANNRLNLYGGGALSLAIGQYIFKQTTYAIGTLPSASANAGARAFVSNGVSTAAFGSVASTTGTASMPVFSNGTNWVYG